MTFFDSTPEKSRWAILLYVPGPAYASPQIGTEVVVPVAVEVPDGVAVALRVERLERTAEVLPVRVAPELAVGTAEFVAVLLLLAQLEAVLLAVPLLVLDAEGTVENVAVPKLLRVPLAVPDAVLVLVRVAPELPVGPADLVAVLLPLARLLLEALPKVRPLLEAVPDEELLLVAVGEAELLAIDEPEATLLLVPQLVPDTEGAVENVAVPKLLRVPLAVPDAVLVLVRQAPELPVGRADFVAALLLLAQREARPLLETVPEKEPLLVAVGEVEPLAIDEPVAVPLAVLLAVLVAVRLLEALPLPSPHATSRKTKILPSIELQRS